VNDTSATPAPQGDLWKQWLLHRRNPTDELAAKQNEGLKPIRDEVLENAHIGEGETVLDVGTGTGLIAFGALEQVGEKGTVIFSDISADCLDYCQTFAGTVGIANRCRFVHAPIEDLSAIPDSSVDVVTSRSVLIYCTEKQHAFNEVFRVLRPGGRFSLFEPINRFGFPERRRPEMFRGYDTTPIAPLIQKITNVIDAYQPVEGSPMLDFDERDLITFARTAGFSQVHLDYKARIAPGRPGSWEFFYCTAPNPLALSLEEAVARSLTIDERKLFLEYMRPKVENEFHTHQSAHVFMLAVR
jgi:ubiquinone/menaquinone biosynthesis C-methylase UbiE